MEKKHPLCKKTKEMMVLPKSAQTNIVPAIFEYVELQKNVALPTKKPRKYVLPEILLERQGKEELPPPEIMPYYRPHLPTKLTKKVMPIPLRNPQVGQSSYQEEKYPSWTDVRLTPRYLSPDSERTSSKKPCSCEKCHFEFEEREVFPYLPQEISAHLQQEHQVLKQNNYPVHKVLEHGKQELNYFRKYLPTPLLHKIESEHKQLEQKYFATGHLQQASSCGCSSAPQIPKNLNVNSSCAPPLPKKMPLQTCCHSCNCNPCCCHPQEMQKKSSCSHSCQPCCCHSCCCCCSCCQHPQQINSCSEYSPLPSVPSPSPIPTTTPTPYTPPSDPGLPYSGPFGPPTGTPTTSYPPLYKTIRDAFLALLKEMQLWGIEISFLKEMVEDCVNRFYDFYSEGVDYEAANKSLEGISLADVITEEDNSYSFSDGFMWIDNVLKRGSDFEFRLRYSFYYTNKRQQAEKLKAGMFYQIAGWSALINEPYYNYPEIPPKYLTVSTLRALWQFSVVVVQTKCVDCSEDAKADPPPIPNVAYESPEVKLAFVLRLAGHLYLAKAIGGATYTNAKTWFEDAKKDFITTYPSRQSCTTMLGLNKLTS